MIIKANHLDIINLSASELRLYLSDIDEKWNFDGWDNPILQGLILREDEHGEIIFTAFNGITAMNMGDLPAVQDLFSTTHQSTDLKQLFLAKRFGDWIKRELQKSNNDFAQLMNSNEFKKNIIPALDRQHQLQKEWVAGIDPHYLQPYEIVAGKTQGIATSFFSKISRSISALCH